MAPLAPNEEKVNQALGQFLAETGIQLIGMSQRWPEFDFMGCRMMFVDCNKCEKKQLQIMLMERQAGLNQAEPENIPLYERDIRNYERLLEAPEVFVVRYENTPEQSRNAMERIDLMLRFYVDPNTSLVQMRSSIKRKKD